MAGRALHRHEYIDATAVAERHLETGAAQHRHVGAHARAFDHAPDGVVLAGLARQTADEISFPASGTPLAITVSMAWSMAARLAFCSLAPFPMTHSPGRPNLAPSTTSPSYGIRHGRGRLVHGIADEHQRLATGSHAVGGDQIAHGVVANVGKAHAAQPGLDRALDERLEQRLVLEQLGLRAWHFHQLDQQFLRPCARDSPVQELLDRGLVHRRPLRA